MSALASGCLLGAFIKELALEILEIVRFERNRNGRIGPELREAALQFNDKFRRFLPLRLGCDFRGSAGSQKAVEPFPAEPGRPVATVGFAAQVARRSWE
jgi:hypothetical protein